MLGVNEISILSIHVEDVLEHAENKAWYGENLEEGTETELARKGDEERNCQQSKKYPPLLTPSWHEDCHQDGDGCQ